MQCLGLAACCFRYLQLLQLSPFPLQSSSILVAAKPQDHTRSQDFTYNFALISAKSLVAHSYDVPTLTF